MRGQGVFVVMNHVINPVIGLNINPVIGLNRSSFMATFGGR
jgi:hypothetical protein